MTDNATIELTVNNISSDKIENVVSVDNTVNSIIVEEQENVVEVSQSINEVTVSSVGIQGVRGETGETGQQGIQGPQGETGPTGPQGPRGVPGEGALQLSYTFEQQSISSLWTINHNLGYKPHVTIQDYGKTTIEGEVQYIDVNNLTVGFATGVSGYAYLS